MSGAPSDYLVNIIPLFNVASGITGTSAADDLTTAVKQLQSMLDFTTLTLNIDIINGFTSSQPYIEIVKDINLSNTNLYKDNVLVDFGSYLVGSNQPDVSTFIFLNLSSMSTSYGSLNYNGSTLVEYIDFQYSYWSRWRWCNQYGSIVSLNILSGFEGSVNLVDSVWC
jgi:hypothetical protein